MVAKIGRGSNLYGALAYNELKVEKENGRILFTNKIIETPDDKYTIAQLSRSFEPYLVANRNTEKPILHISLNPDPRDNVSDEKYNLMAQQYMQEMGYGQQPFIVFKHTDIERTHIHIVSVCVDEEGKKISDRFDKRRSMDVCRSLEQKYNLIPAGEKQSQSNTKIFKPVDYKAGGLKSQMASVIGYLPQYYRFQGLGTYNALLSLFNIAAEQVNGELRGEPKSGLVYFALNEQGEKASNPFKSSLFGKHAGLLLLSDHFEKSGKILKSDTSKPILKNLVEAAMYASQSEQEFKETLLEQGINTIVRRNNDGRIYGITFVDHEHKNVWNGSALGKDFSANVFNQWWNNGSKPGVEASVPTARKEESISNIKTDLEPHQFFDFISTQYKPSAYREPGLVEGLGSLLSEIQHEDYEEPAFENRKKKRKRRRKDS